MSDDSFALYGREILFTQLNMSRRVYENKTVSPRALLSSKVLNGCSTNYVLLKLEETRG